MLEALVYYTEAESVFVEQLKLTLTQAYATESTEDCLRNHSSSERLIQLWSFSFAHFSFNCCDVEI